MAVSLNGILGAVVEFGRDGVTITDNQIQPPGSRILYVNPAFSRITGYSSNEIIGKSPRILQGPRTDRTVLDRLRDCLLHGEPFFGETYNYRKDGTEFIMEWQMSPAFDPSGEISQWVAIQRDVTEIRRVSNELQTSLAKWQSVVDTAPDFLLILDPAGRIVFINRTDQRVTMADVVGHSLYEFVDGKYTEELKQAVSHTFCTGDFTHCDFMAHVAREPVWYRARFGPYRENQSIAGVVCIASDVSAIKRSEHFAYQRMAELARVLRLGSMNEMASSLAHELKQPLTVVSNYASGACRLLEACVKEYQEPDDDSPTVSFRSECIHEIREALQRIVDQSRSAGRIVTRWKQFIARTDASRSTVDLNCLLREVISFTRPYADEFYANVVFQASAPSPMVSVDSVQIQQVLVNLLNNAFEAMSDVPVDQRTVFVTTALNESDVVVEVTNPGRELNELEIRQAFEAFFTTKPDGLGMGLSVSKTIIEMHEGRISAEPGPRGGVLFRFSLPLIEDSHA